MRTWAAYKIIWQKKITMSCIYRMSQSILQCIALFANSDCLKSFRRDLAVLALAGLTCKPLNLTHATFLLFQSLGIGALQMRTTQSPPPLGILCRDVPCFVFLDFPEIHSLRGSAGPKYFKVTCYAPRLLIGRPQNHEAPEIRRVS